jgi:hypothetical protein
MFSGIIKEQLDKAKVLSPVQLHDHRSIIGTAANRLIRPVVIGLFIAGISACGGGGGVHSPAAETSAVPPTVVDKFPLIPTPTVTGPTVNEPFSSSAKNYTFYYSDVALAARGYVEEEFYIEGKANAYDTPVPAFGPSQTPPSTLSKVVTANVPYKTRMKVRRPTDPAKFNGMVVVEWFNATDNFDGEYFWAQAKDQLLRDGYAYIGVSPQNAPISNSIFGLKKFSSVRYGTLDVTNGGTLTGDPLSYDIFAQTAKAAIAIPKVLNGLTVKHVMGAGMSQSGMRVAQYANYVHMGAPIYEGFIVQVAQQLLRDDLPTPVIEVLSETEAGISPTVNLSKIQADTPLRHIWWAAGTAHGDSNHRIARTGIRLRDLGAALSTDDNCVFNGVPQPARTRTPFKHVVSAAVHHLRRQIETGAVPPSSPKFDTTTAADGTITLNRDSNGNALGAIRLAHMAVPTATAVGFACGSPGNGAWTPFPSSVVNALYTSHSDYVAKVTSAVNASITAGFVLPDDGALTIKEAEISIYGMGLQCGRFCLSQDHITPTFASTGLLIDHTFYYNTPKGDDLIEAVGDAHLWVARGYSDAAGSEASRYNFGMGIAALQRYIALVNQAQSDGRMTSTAAGLLVSIANTIIRGIEVL